VYCVKYLKTLLMDWYYSVLQYYYKQAWLPMHLCFNSGQNLKEQTYEKKPKMPSSV